MTINVWDYLKPNRQMEMTVWRDEADEEGMTFETRVDLTESGRFFIKPPAELLDSLHSVLTHGMLVGVTMATDKGPIIFYPKMTVAHKEPPGFWFSAPPGMQAELVFRREFIRVDFTKTFRIEVPINNTRTEMITVVGEDLSGGGVKFRCSRLLAKNLRFTVHLQLHEDTPVLKLDSRIVASEEAPVPANTPSTLKFSCACQFMAITEQNQTAIVGECFRLQLARNRKNND